MTDRLPGDGDWWIVGNPVSGRGQGARAMQAAEGWLRARGQAFHVAPTRAPGDATALAAEAVARSASVVVGVGGDGTLRDIAASLAGADTRLLPLPAGTGNDLCRTLGILRHPTAALEAASSGVERQLDLWLWNDQPFLNVAALGVDAAVGAAVNRRFRRVRGTLAYLLAVGAVLPHYRPMRLELTGDATYAGDAWLAAFASAQSYGGGMRIAPHAEPDDGWLDIVIVEAVPLWRFLAKFPRVFRGTHIREPEVKTFRVREVEVSTQPLQPITLDGEILGTLPARIRRHPHPVHVCVPKR